MKLHKDGVLRREERTKYLHNKIFSEDIVVFWEETYIQLHPLNPWIPKMQTIT